MAVCMVCGGVRGLWSGALLMEIFLMLRSGIVCGGVCGGWHYCMFPDLCVWSDVCDSVNLR